MLRSSCAHGVCIGYSNAEFCPSKNQQVRALTHGVQRASRLHWQVRTYNDLWQLKIDMPGGNWKPKDLERDIRMERMGPWSRCFTCGVCDISWQKCELKVHLCITRFRTVDRDCFVELFPMHSAIRN